MDLVQFVFVAVIVLVVAMAILRRYRRPHVAPQRGGEEGHHHHPPEPCYGPGMWGLLFLLTLGLLPKLWGKRELHRPVSATSKAVMIVHGFNFFWRIWEIMVFAGLLVLIVNLFGDDMEALPVVLGLYATFAAFYHAGFFTVRVISYAVEKDGQQITGVVYLSGRHWRFPFAYDVDMVDYRVRRTTATFSAPLRGGGRLENRLPVKWRPNPRIFDADGENVFFHQGDSAVEQALLTQVSELSALEGALTDEQFQDNRAALVLYQQCQMAVERDLLPHYDEDFLARPEVLKPAGWVGGPIHGALDKLWFYGVNRALIIQELDPIPGEATHEEEGIGETESYFEGLNGVEVEDSGLVPDYDINTQRIVQARLAGRVIRDVIGADAEISAKDVIVTMDKGTVVATTGSGAFFPVIKTEFEGGH